MRLHFFKYQGAGNDFILIDNRKKIFTGKEESLFEALCHRKFGIGADGLMLLQNSDDYDFEMIYANSDGKIGTMCGNGGRCIVAFAHYLGLFEQEVNFMAADGAHYARVLGDNKISLQMIDVNDIQEQDNNFILNTGSPHFVSFVPDAKEIDVFNIGRSIRNKDCFSPKGINVNFAEEMGNGLFVRTYERGVEDETYACGTGATAAVLAYLHKKQLIGKHIVPVKVLGGELEVTAYTEDSLHFNNIYLNGPAVKVFEGFIEI